MEQGDEFDHDRAWAHLRASDDADLSSAFVTSLPIAGASISISVPSGARLTVSSSDPVAARIDELQFELGEGPQWSTAASGETLSIRNVAAAPTGDWPVFATALAQLPVGALFCIPMRMGAVTLGVATLYCTTPTRFTDDQTITALAIAAAVAGPAVRLALRSAAAEADDSLVNMAVRREVHQATGILLVHLNTTATLAYARLQAYAFANDRTLQDVAHDVVNGSLTLEDSREEPGKK